MFAKLKGLGSKSDKSKKDSSNKGRNLNSTPQSAEQGGLLEDFRPREVLPPKPQFHELYRLGDVLGTGAFSVVKSGQRLGSCETFAVKCVDRRKLSDEDTAALLDEVAILRGLCHQHVIRLFDFIEEPENYYLVMEQMCGGELFDRVVAKTYYNEKEARDTCKILLEAMRYCHANNVAHRDLKPENLLLPKSDNDSDVKIADFGFAKWCFKPKSLRTQCGTPGYVAPEILRGELYDTKVDMWSIGVILFILLGGMPTNFSNIDTHIYVIFKQVHDVFVLILFLIFFSGYPPFLETSQSKLFQKIKAGSFEFHAEYWDPISKDAKDLIASLLTVDPDKRLTADEALKNPWLQHDADDLANKDLAKNLEEFKKFNAKRKFRSAIYANMAVHKLQSLALSK